MTDAKDLRIIYMGTPDFAVMPLKALVESGYHIVAVVTTPDKPAGRGLKMQESAVKRYATEVGLPVLQPVKLRDPEFISQLQNLKPDLGIVIAFRMLPEIVWSMPRFGTFNLHASLLPQYRGAAPINWAIINGEEKTGVTTFMLNEEIDKGAILGHREVVIREEDNVGDLHDKLMVVGTELVLESVDKIARGEIIPIDQEQMETGELKGAPKIFKETCRVDWTQSCETIYNKIRGLSPYPAAWSEFIAGDEVIPVKIYAGRKELGNPGQPAGTVLSDGKHFIKAACENGYIFIEELQLAGKKRMNTEDFLRGFKNITNYILQ